jgi:hypothetical protein
MADLKISQLTGATTPLAGTEVLPIVQGGATVKVSVDNLTTGKSVSGASFVPTGSTAPANGVYLPAANTVGISTNSTVRVTFGSTGDVNIATSAAISTAANRTYVSIKGKGTAASDGSGILQFQTNTPGATAGLIGNMEFMVPDNTSSSSFRVAYVGGFASTAGASPNNVGGLLDLATKSDGVTGGGTTRQRIHASGGISMGDTVDPGAGNLRLGVGNLVFGAASKGVTTNGAINLGLGTNGAVNEVIIATATGAREFYNSYTGRNDINQGEGAFSWDNASSATIDLAVLFPDITFTNKGISVLLQAVGGQNAGSGTSYFWNINRTVGGSWSGANISTVGTNTITSVSGSGTSFTINFSVANQYGNGVVRILANT